MIILPLEVTIETTSAHQFWRQSIIPLPEHAVRLLRLTPGSGFRVRIDLLIRRPLELEHTHIEENENARSEFRSGALVNAS